MTMMTMMIIIAEISIANTTLYAPDTILSTFQAPSHPYEVGTVFIAILQMKKGYVMWKTDMQPFILELNVETL